MKNLKEFHRFIAPGSDRALVAEALRRRHVNSDIDDEFLHLARLGDTEGCKRLLASGANINAQDEDSGQTALYLAVQNGHLETTRFLMSEGADPNIKDWQYEETPLDLAVSLGDGDEDFATTIISSEMCSEETLKSAIDTAYVEAEWEYLIPLLYFCSERGIEIDPLSSFGEKEVFDAVAGDIGWMKEGPRKEKLKRMQKVRNIFGK